MLWALNDRGERIQASPGASGSCPTCGEPVNAKCGDIIVHHWAHRARSDCDPWSEPESEWHLGWKRAFETAGADTEVTMRTDDQWHRADVVVGTGTIIELQHGYLPVEQIRAREAFYGAKLVWLYDAHWIDRVEFYGPRQLRWRRPADSMVAHQQPVFWHIGAHNPRHKAGRIIRVQLRYEDFGYYDTPVVVGGWDPFPKEPAFIRKMLAGQPCRVCNGPVWESSRTPDCHPSCNQWPNHPDPLRPYGVAS